jgi:hypothetical protein
MKKVSGDEPRVKPVGADDSSVRLDSTLKGWKGLLKDWQAVNRSTAHGPFSYCPT